MGYSSQVVYILRLRWSTLADNNNWTHRARLWLRREERVELSTPSRGWLPVASVAPWDPESPPRAYVGGRAEEAITTQLGDITARLLLRTAHSPLLTTSTLISPLLT